MQGEHNYGNYGNLDTHYIYTKVASLAPLVQDRNLGRLYSYHR